MKESIILELSDNLDRFDFKANIQSELEKANIELESLNESLQSIKLIRAECDKIDYMLAVSSGAISGIIDIFLVGKPKESVMGDITDEWFENRVKDFARICGWNDSENNSYYSAIRFLENKFKVLYDQTGMGDAGKDVYGLTPRNHHFKSLGHNFSLVGLFFSILDQFTNQSHFVSDGMLISLHRSDDSFELVGRNFVSKLFCGFVNWIGHLISDVSGSSGSVGRGMGIPSPLLTWINDIIVIKNELNIKSSEFDKSLNELALKIFEEGFDVRFLTTQAIPVVINEMNVRLIYSIRRMINYFSKIKKEDFSFKELWLSSEPFSNPTIKRMLTIAHGTFCLIDLGDSIIRASYNKSNVTEYFLRINAVGIGRFTVSLYGEAKRGIIISKNKHLLHDLNQEKSILNYYIEGLRILSDEYNDENLISLINDLSTSDIYISIFNASVELANKREVEKEKILCSKKDGDDFFRGGSE